MKSLNKSLALLKMSMQLFIVLFMTTELNKSVDCEVTYEIFINIDTYKSMRNFDERRERIQTQYLYYVSMLTYEAKTNSILLLNHRTSVTYVQVMNRTVGGKTSRTHDDFQINEFTRKQVRYSR